MIKMINNNELSIRMYLILYVFLQPTNIIFILPETLLIPQILQYDVKQ